MSLVEAFFRERYKPGVYPSNFFKKGLQHRRLPIWILLGNYFKIIGKFFARCLCKTFSDKVASFQSIGCDFIGNNLFDKNL